jgi:hypothetical protein
MKSDECSYILSNISVSIHDVTDCDVTSIQLQDLTIISRLLLPVTVFISIVTGSLNKYTRRGVEGFKANYEFLPSPLPH